MASPSASYNDSISLFKLASDSFRDNLPVRERNSFKHYENATSMISEIQDLARSHPVNRSKLMTACRKIDGLACKLEPYFEVINIFVQIQPEYAGLVWGSLRMLFKLSSNYVTYLERLCSMFEDIASILPAYEQYANILQDRARSTGHSFPRIAMTLTHVYVDILRFFHNACLLFSKERRGVALKASFIGRLIWKPFDLQFADVLKRLENHKTLFELEVSLASTEESLRFYAKCEADLREVERKLGPGDNSDGKESSSINARVKKLQKWIDPPKWMESFEQAQNRRAAGTGDWISDNDVYRIWRTKIRNPDTALAVRSLSIQAKPGYGKTVLCQTIIEDLREYILDIESSSHQLSPSVIFYFFDKRRGAFNSHSDAIRAMVAQLIHLHRHNKQTIDIASMILAKDTTGQFTATDNEVFAVLNLLLEQLQLTFLVFDGLDECSDYPELFKRLEENASRSCALLFLSRPTVQLPGWLRKDCFKIHPTHLENTEDIERFLRPEIRDLIDIEVLPEDEDAEEIVQLILPRASGMFLWVRLLVDYLRLPALTIRERLYAIRNLNRLEGLDALYNAILDGIESQPRTSALTVRHIFQWVARGRRPFHVDELRALATIPLDRRQMKEDTIPNFENSLSHLSGALIELTFNGTAQFVHLSAQDFFRGTGEYAGEAISNSTVNKYRELADRYIAISCLSYLCFTVPPEPLGGDSRITPDAVVAKHRFPALKYVAEFWSYHLVPCLTEPGNVFDTSNIESWQQLADLLTSFLSDRRKTSVWIEASWLLCKPNDVEICPLSGDEEVVLHRLAESVGASFERLKNLMIDFREFSRDVKTLSQSWSNVLRSEPNEIWEPSLLAFANSRFLMETSNARVWRLARSESDSAPYITLQSQVSDTGSEMSLVKLLPPSSWGIQTDEGLGKDQDWKARYELWSLDSNTNISSVEISLPFKSLSPFLRAKAVEDETEDGDEDIQRRRDGDEETRGPREPSVSIPVATSHDLRRATILDVAIEVLILESSDGESMETDNHVLRSQILDFDDSQFPNTSEQKDGLEYEAFYHIKFSLSGEFFVRIQESTRKQRKGNDLYSVGMRMQVFRDSNYWVGRGLNYVALASITCWTVPEISLLSVYRGLAFHPHLPRLAFAQTLDGMPQTYLWKFDSPMSIGDCPGTFSNPYPVHDPPIVDISFSDDGDYLYGTDAPLEFGYDIRPEKMPLHSKPLIVKVPDQVPVAGAIGDDTVVSKIQLNPFQSSEVARRALFELATRPKPPVQRANTLVFDRDEGGVVYVSRMHQLEREAAVVLQTVGTNGRFQSETLSRLPKEVLHCVDVSLIPPSLDREKDHVRIMLNKAPERFYTADDIGKNILPAMIERDRDSIPTFISTVPMSLDYPADSSRQGDQLQLPWGVK